MNKANYLGKDDFPLDREGLDFIQKMVQSVSKLTDLGGKNYILNGCEEFENDVKKGMLVINGELIEFSGGVKKGKIRINETKENLTVGINVYPEAYIYRIAEFSDTGEYNWADFSRILTNKEIEEKINNLKGEPIGVVKDWAGLINRIPDEYMLCDGRVLKTTEYPDLFNVIGFLHGIDGSDGFRLPNTFNKFSIGYSGTGETSTIGDNGGENKVTLESKHTPKHRHKYTDDINANGKFPGQESGFPNIVDSLTLDSSGSSSGKGAVYYTTYVGGNEKGETEAHENRPEFIVFARIIKVK